VAGKLFAPEQFRQAFEAEQRLEHTQRLILARGTDRDVELELRPRTGRVGLGLALVPSVRHRALPPRLVALHKIRRSARDENVEAVALRHDHLREVRDRRVGSQIVTQRGVGAQSARRVKRALERGDRELVEAARDGVLAGLADSRNELGDARQ